MSFLQVSFLDITGRRGRRRHMRRDSTSRDTSFVCSVIIFEVSFDSLALPHASTRLRRSIIYFFKLFVILQNSLFLGRKKSTVRRNHNVKNSINMYVYFYKDRQDKFHCRKNYKQTTAVRPALFILFFMIFLNVKVRAYTYLRYSFDDSLVIYFLSNACTRIFPAARCPLLFLFFIFFSDLKH